MTGARMPSIGTGGIDVRSLINSVVNVVKSRANQVCTAPCDGLILKMHYRWTFCIFIAGFFTVWYQWYHRDVITCVSHFNAETQVRLDYINVCLSYPFVEEEGKRRYLLFYRWIHWSLLLLAGFYYIPRKISKSLESVKAKKLMEDLASNACRYDQVEKDLLERAARFVSFNLKTHNGLYLNFVIVNIVALFIDIIAFQYLDFIFQGKFMEYGFKAYPFERDPKGFSDYMSKMFPPFAYCELTKVNKLVNQRTERLGCHLTIMELYEKVFLGLWIWLILLTAATLAYIIFLGLMVFPRVRVYLLRTAKPIHANDRVRETINRVSHNCKVGDMYLLYRLKQHFSHARFYELLLRLSDPELTKVTVNHGNPGDRDDIPAHKKQQLDALRNRKPVQQDPPLNPEYLHLLNSQSQQGQHRFPPNVKGIPTPQGVLMNPELAQKIPLMKNTSILIE